MRSDEKGWRVFFTRKNTRQLVLYLADGDFVEVGSEKECEKYRIFASP